MLRAHQTSLLIWSNTFVHISRTVKLSVYRYIVIMTVLVLWQVRN